MQQFQLLLLANRAQRVGSAGNYRPTHHIWSVCNELERQRSPGTGPEHVHRRAEIGWTFVAPAWQRTPANTEAKYLMLRHGFEERGWIRIELKTDVLNEKSRRAILRIGAREEGILRSHQVTDNGRVRDTVYYSVIAPEWPAVKADLERKLGRAIIERFRVYNHNPWAWCRNVGTTTRGTPLWINTEVMSADLKIGIGGPVGSGKTALVETFVAQVRATAGNNRARLASTDSEGRFEFRDLPSGRWNITASKAGFVTLRYGQRRPFEAGRPIEVADGQVMNEIDFTLPRGAVVRQTINHLVHHRGQLTVYLRLLDVPVPSIYGPTADERAPGL